MTAVPAWAWLATFGVLGVLIAADVILTSRVGEGLRAADRRVAELTRTLWMSCGKATLVPSVGRKVDHEP